MKRKAFCFCLILILLFSGCGMKAQAPSQQSYYTFTDSVGNEVVLQEQPQRVAVLFSSYAEVWTLAGGEVYVTVGESVERGFADADTILVDDGAGKQIDQEALVASGADFVIGSADIEAHADACEIANKAGIPAALFRVDTFEEYLSMLKICTDITGNGQAYQTYGLDVQDEIGQIMQTVDTYDGETRNILFVRAGSQYSSTKAKRAPENFVCIMLDELGAHNIADDAEILLDGLSLEEIMLQDPDHIFISTMGDEQAAKSYMLDLFAQDGWENLSAVKQENYTFLPKNLFHFKPNQNWGQAYRMLAETLYPELEF